MASPLPISLEILACFILSTALLNRYSDMVNHNIITVVGVFVSWFFSFLVIFLLPADLTSTAYRQCIADFEASINSTTTTTPLPPSVNSSSTSAPIMSSTPWANPTDHMILLHPNSSSSTNFSLLGESGGLQDFMNTPSGNLTNPCVVPWNYVSDKVLTKLWRFIYWTSQILTWLILPIMQSYSMAGDFTTLDKLKSAFRRNFIYYSSIGAIFSVLLIYVIFKNGLDFANLKVIAISSSNTWGLFLLVVLLGYGLVELPRFLINRSRYADSLSRQYFRVARVNAEKCEAEEKLDDVLEEIHQAFAALGTNDNNPLSRYLNQIVDKCPPDWKRRSNAFRRQAAASNTTYDSGERTKIQTHDIQSMTRLHRKVIKAVHYHNQITCRWNHLIREVIEWEDVARNQTENRTSLTDKQFKSTLPRERSFINSIFNPRVEWYWKCLVRVWLFRVLGVILATFSLAVVWSEITFPISIVSPKLSVFAYFVDSFQTVQQYFYMELFSLISIGYLAICAFYTVFHMKIYNVYYLASNKQTDEYSLLFSGMLICRLSAPLCLNYLCLVHRDSHIIKQNSLVETSFTTIMGHLDLIPLVNSGLNVFLPLCISAICLAIYFNFGTHVLHYFGFEQFIENDEMTIDWVQTGRELVKRETLKLVRAFESSSSTNYREMVSASQTDPPAPEAGYATEPAKARGTNQSAGAVTFGDDSPSSQSSSSSGFSRSSLLPRSGRIGANQNNQTAPDVTTARGQPRMGDNMIEIDMDVQQAPDQPKTSGGSGFFDDV